MKVMFFKMARACPYLILFLIVGVIIAHADFQITDDLTMYGFVKQTSIFNTGTSNPNLVTPQQPGKIPQEKKNDFNLMRSNLQFEFEYSPTEIFKVYTKTRVAHDQTQSVDSNLNDYDPFTWEPDNKIDLVSAHGDDNYQADVWEIWANFEIDNVWLRLGKQQIAWGDLPGVRIADKINPLDISWHLSLEPEEYENVRIPQWAFRLYYTFPETMIGPFSEVFTDFYINPGDVRPDNQPASGSPYDNGWKSFVNGNDHYDDNYREMEWGARLGFNLGNLSTTFNYLSIHYHSPIWDWRVDPSPAEWLSSIEFPEIDIYAMTMSYAFAQPLNITATFEGSYTPDQPWQTAASAPGPFGPEKGEGDFYRGALYLEKTVFFMNSISRYFFPGKIGFMYYLHHISDGDDIKINWAPGPPNDTNRLDWNMHQYYLSYTLPFGPGAMFQLNPKVFWTPEGAYKTQCFLKYQPNYDWRFDIGVLAHGGSGDEHWMMFDSIEWMDEVYARITYMF